MSIQKTENFILFLKDVISSLRKIDVILKNVSDSGQTKETNDIISVFEELFNDNRYNVHFEYKITLIGKSSQYYYWGERNEENSNKHLTLNLKSEEIIFYNNLYDNKISDLLKFFKHLFSLIENFSIIESNSRVAKFQNLLTEIRRDFIFWESVLRKSLNDLDDQKKLLHAFSFLSYTTEKKSNWQDYLKILSDKNVNCLYHFTDRSNIDSIKSHKGLYSWFYCENNNIDIVKPGGNGTSRKLDKDKNLENYVRLSFCENHPMAYVLKRDGRISDIVVLKCDTEVILHKNTLFSNCNANKSEAVISDSLELFKDLRFDIFGKKYFDVNKDNKLKSFYQAEVLVAKHLPMKYILNIDNI